MTKSENMPIWVFLAVMNFETRKGANVMVWISLLITLVCVPLSYYQPFETVDWTWIAMMAGTTLWYWLSMKWVDKNTGWEKASQK